MGKEFRAFDDVLFENGAGLHVPTGSERGRTRKWGCARPLWKLSRVFAAGAPGREDRVPLPGESSTAAGARSPALSYPNPTFSSPRRQRLSLPRTLALPWFLPSSYPYPTSDAPCFSWWVSEGMTDPSIDGLSPALTEGDAASPTLAFLFFPPGGEECTLPRCLHSRHPSVRFPGPGFLRPEKPRTENETCKPEN